jgi:hypothetical protein
MSVDHVSNSVEVEDGREGFTEKERVTRSHPVLNSGMSSSNSMRSAGDSIRSSSINSSDIRNCNKLFLEKYDRDVALKVWKGAASLGVEENSVSGGGILKKGSRLGTKEDCILEIMNNEKRDEEESIRREQRKSVHP